MKHYSNIEVIKLKEYSQSYGGRETINYAYGIDTVNSGIFTQRMGYIPVP